MKRPLPDCNNTIKLPELTRQATIRVTTAFVLLICSMVLFCPNSNAQGSWTKVTVNSPDASGGVMLLLTDGTVLCKTTAGGGHGKTWTRLTPDIHGSYINGTWTTMAAMHDDRLYFSSQVMPDGRVYVAGGEYGSGGPKSEVWDPATNVWTMCPQIVTAHDIADANSELLYTGKVLQAVVDTGFSDLNYLWDPATNTYSKTGKNIHTNNEAMWVKLADSSIVVSNNYGFLSWSERYIPSSGTWLADGTTAVDLYDPISYESGAGFLLPDGRAYLIGSAPVSTYYTPTGNSTPGTWAAGPALPNGWGAPDAAAAMMSNGKILMALSPTPTSGDNFPDSTAFYEFDYTTNTYTIVGAPGVVGDTLKGLPTFYTNMLDLPDGGVLFCNQYDTKYYEYKSAAGPIAAGQPSISTIIEQTCDSFTITGTLFNGISEGAGYGDDWQMSSNYPIVRLTSGANVYYATTSYWNRIGAVLTGALPDTAQFKLPAGLPDGTYDVVVTANGNPSAPYSLTVGPAVITPSVTAICSGNTTTLSSSLSGGTWSSSATTVATIDVSGFISGITSGSATITYSIGACAAEAAVTVNATPVAITPASLSVCIGTSGALSDATLGGAWSSSATGIATVDISGNVSGLVSGSATITYAIGACAAEATVTVNNTLAAISPASLAVCLGASGMLSDATIGGTWTSDNTTAATVFGSGSVTGSGVGTANISYTQSGCSVTAAVTVNPLPGSITGATETCIGSNTTLIDAGGGDWTSSNTTVATIDPLLGNVSGLASGTTTITYALPTGCEATTVVTVDPPPAAIIGATIVCVGLTSSLSDPDLGGTWTSSTSSVATIDPASGLVNGISTGSATITYTLSTGCYNTVAMLVNASPGPVTGITNVCTGSVTALSDVGGGAWTSSNTSFATVDAVTGIVSGVSPGAVTITYALGAGCTSYYPVTVDPSPAPVSGVTTVCAGSSTTLSDAGGGTWSSSNTVAATVGLSTGLVSGVASGTTTITYTTGATCEVTASVTVNAAPVVAAVTGPGNVCTGSAIPLTDATAGGAWSSSSTAVATVSGSGIVNGISAGIAFIAYSLTNACGTTAPYLAVTVNALPVVAPVSGSVSLCVLASNTLSDATLSGVWSSGNTTIATIDPFGVASGVAAGAAMITYDVTDIFGCSQSVMTTVTVNPLVPVTITPASSTTFCTGGYVSLNATIGVGYHYQWQAGGIIIAGATTAGYISNYSGNFTVVITGTGLCTTTSAAVSVVVNPAPAVVPSVTVTAAPGIVLCNVTSPVTFSPTPSYGGLPTYEWFVNGSLIAAGGTYTYSPANGDIVKCLMNSTDICAFPDTAVTNTTMTISPLQTPSVSISASPSDTVCAGTLTTFTAVPLFGGPFPSYQWMNKAGLIVATGPANTYRPADLDVVTCAMVSDYSCLAVSSAISPALTLHVEANTLNLDTIKVTRTTIVTGQIDTFVVIAPYGGASPAYQWYLNGIPITGATGATYITAGLVSGDKIFCGVTSSDLCASPKINFSNTISVLVGTGVSNINETGGFTLVPNPNKGEFTISGTLENPADNAVNIVITDMLGQTVYTETAQAANGNFTRRITLGASIANGMYLVKITNGEGHEVFRIVVNK